MQIINKKQLELLQEIYNIRDYVTEEIANGNADLAEEYLSDAAYLINKIEDPKLKDRTINSFPANPLDYAK